MAGYWAIRSLFHPRISSAPGAMEEVRDILEDPDKRLLIAANHQHWADEAALAAMATHKNMRGLIGYAEILTKPPLFNIARPIRYLIDELGSVPIFRSKDGHTPQEAIAVNQELNKVYAEDITEGITLVAHMQGERKPENAHILGKLKDGLGHIACAVDDSVELYTLPVGIWYGDEPTRLSRLAPFMHLGEVYETPRDNPKSFTAMTEVRLQAALDQAIAMSE